MVEMDYFGLKSKKYCNPQHSSCIEVLCTEDGTLCCADCAADHSDHFFKVKDIKSIFESQQAHYRELKTRIKILSKMQNSTDEIRSYVAQLLESSFDQIIARVADMKAQWIEENFSKIMDSLDIDLEQKRPDLDILATEVEETFTKIHNFVNSEVINSEEVMKLKQPEEFEPLIVEILKTSTIRRSYKDIKIDIQFKGELVKNMINIKGISRTKKMINIKDISRAKDIKNEISVFNKEDVDFALSLLPPVKEMKMLYSGRRDGPNTSIFHTKCDGVGDTLVLCKTTNGHSFGGFAKPPWHSDNAYSRDDSKSCFLFTCRNKTKHTLTDPEHAIYCSGNYGPIFGSTFDLNIQNNKCYNKTLGTAYSIPVEGKREDYLCGPDGTAIDDYEVHQVIFQ